MNIKQLRLKGLIDERNERLFKELNENYTISIVYTEEEKEYSCYSRNKTSTIYVPFNQENAAYFTHELLHILLRQKDIFIGAALQRTLNNNSSLRNIYSSKLIEHMGNCLDHIKMLPVFLELGYDRNSFISDFNLDKCTEYDLRKIEKNFKSWWAYNGSAIDMFIGKLFSIKACPNSQIDYLPKLERLKKVNSTLYAIQQNIFTSWEKVDINEKDILAFNYNDVVIDYQNAMEDWVVGKKIK